MHIFPVTDQWISAFSPMLPQSGEASRILGASVDGVNCGVAVVEHMGHRHSISWLWVEPEYRQRGVGSALLERVCQLSFAKEDEAVGELTVSWPMDAPWAPELERMLCKQGFLYKAVPIHRLRMTARELERTPLLTTPIPKDSASRVVPFSAVSRLQRNRLRMECEELGLYQISRASYHLADHELSQVLLVHDQAAGIVLLRREGEGVISLDLLGLRKGHTVGALALLRTAAETILKQGFQELVFDSVEDSATRLASRLLGREGERVFLCQGRLPLGAYRSLQKKEG